MATERRNSEPLAIIGLGCRYPGAANVLDLWENILTRRIQFRRIPNERLPLKDYYNPDRSVPDKTYGAQAALIDGFTFDWRKFRIPKQTFESTDMAHWLALEVSLAALEDAGYGLGTIPVERTGVIVGNTLTGEFTRSNMMRLRWPFVERCLKAAATARGVDDLASGELASIMQEYYKSVFPPENEDSLAGGLANTIAGRICNFHDFHGCGYIVDGACSSSLIAVAQAGNALASGDLDLAVAGGVDISLDPFELIGFAKTSALTPDHMRVYDRRGNGFIPGEGAGFVVMKRLEDARKDGDYIYAYLQGWGISSDGKGGITAPSAAGQARALERAYNRAPYSVRDVDFFEGHGTGTTRGDKTELSGIARALGSDGKLLEKQYGVTSFKSIVRHTKAAAGIGGFIKAVIAVNRRVLPPLAGCEEPNPIFTNEAKDLYPLRRGKVMDTTHSMKAGISAMGFGGSNSHATVEAADPPSPKLNPLLNENALLKTGQDSELFLLAAPTMEELSTRIQEVKVIAEGIAQSELSDFSAHIMKQLSSDHPVRAALVVEHVDGLIVSLDYLDHWIEENPPAPGEWQSSPRGDIWIGNTAAKKRIAYLYPGQGSQRPGMGRSLFVRYPWALKLKQKAAQGLQVDEKTFASFMDPDDALEAGPDWKKLKAKMAATEIAQPLICLTEACLTELLHKLGIQPDCVGGHSLGELAAFHAGGAFSDEDLIDLTILRGQLMAAPAGQAGKMASLVCSREQAEGVLEKVDGFVVLANINSPRQVLISGDGEAVEKACKVAEEQKIAARVLNLSNAFHTKYVAGAAETFKAKAVFPPLFTPGEVKIYSSMTCKRLSGEMNPAEYFADQMISQVCFTELVAAITADSDLLIETGPGRVLTNLVQDIDKNIICLPLEPKAGHWNGFHRVMGALFTGGHDLNGEVLFENRLIRPFVPPSEKLFITNPCERPLSGPAAGASTQTGLGNILSDSHVDKEALSAYLSQRGDFIAKVIEADMEHLQPGHPAMNRERKSPLKTAAPTVSAAREQTAVPAAQGNPFPNPAEFLLKLAAEKTGFPSNSISLENKLLDDLNMDSIKAGDFIGEAVKIMDLTGEIDPGALANASLEEIAETLQALKKDSTFSLNEPREIPGTPDILLELASERTGFPVDSLSLDNKLLDDLNLDSIKAADFIGDAIKRYNFPGNLDPSSLANASLDQIHTVMMTRRAAETSPQPEIIRTEAASGGAAAKRTEKGWVRSFYTSFRQMEEQGASTVPFPPKGSLALVCCKEDRDWTSRTAGQMQNIASTVITYDDLENAPIEKNSHYLFVSPRLPIPAEEALTVFKDQLQDTVTRLRQAALFMAHSGMSSRSHSFTFLQFGGGFFGCRDQEGLLSPLAFSTLAFARSIHLELPRLTIHIMDVPAEMGAKQIADCYLNNFPAGHTLRVDGFDKNGKRWAPVEELVKKSEREPDSLDLGTEDTIVVSAGGKGVTAHCALALAGQKKARFALLGRTQRPSAAGTELSEGQKEIQQTLERFQSLGVKAQYFSCDISDLNSVQKTVNQIHQEMGEIRGIIHGAALNIPRRASAPTAVEALDEITPKVIGMQNLLHAVGDAPLKLIVGLTSIIGVTGMMGNSWYGFSNELMNVMLRSYALAHPAVKVVTTAFSVWGEIGMGERMGSVKALGEMGIEAIPPERGAEHFLRVLLMKNPDQQVVITGRIGTLNTWQRQPLDLNRKHRYLEELVNVEPGVEALVKARVTHAKDPYLLDHCLRGSYLLPTVFGLEAMAQAAWFLEGDPQKPLIRIEEINLRFPITVPENGETEILLEALSRDEDGPEQRVKVGIKCDNSGFSRYHFDAVFVFAREKAQKPKEENPLGLLEIELPTAYGINPEEDLYGKVLFQGPRFRRIQTLNLLSEKKCLFTSAYRNPNQDQQEFILGDPYFRDTLLQSCQLFTPGRLCLPIKVEKWEIQTGMQNGTYRVEAQLLASEAEQTENSVSTVDKNGRVMEKLTGYQLRFLDKESSGFTIEDLLSPEEWDSKLLKEKLKEAAKLAAFPLPAFTLNYVGNMHQLSLEKRHALEQELTAPLLSSEKKLVWTESGKPEIEGENEVSISFSHDAKLLLAATGRELGGCDVEISRERSREQWIDLLGKEREALYGEVMDMIGNKDRAGLALWSAVESVRKATDLQEKTVSVIGRFEDFILFESPSHLVISFHLQLTWGAERFFAFAFSKSSALKLEKLRPASQEKTETPYYGGLILERQGPRGEAVFRYRFPLTFQENANLGRGVYFTNYFKWIGKVRELMLEPVARSMTEQFMTGEWGMVTNHSKTTILGQAENFEQIDVVFWIDSIHGSKDSTIDMLFEWRKVAADGSVRRIAISEQQTTWFKIISHGVVEPYPFPDYFKKFLQDIQPKKSLENHGESLILTKPQLGNVLWENNLQPGEIDFMMTESFLTSLTDSNLVGNNYFANYFTWQGHVRDQLFYSFSPEHFLTHGEKGELLCLESSVHHLRESMPFDRIRTGVTIRKAYERGADLYFEYFKERNDGSHEKLAYGNQQVAWGKQDADGKIVPMGWPRPFREKLIPPSSVIRMRVDSQNETPWKMD